MKYLLLLSIVGLAFGASVPVQDGVQSVREGTCPVNYAFPEENCVSDCQEDSDCGSELEKCCITSNCGLKCVNSEPEVASPEADEKTKEEITKMLTTILEERTDLTQKLEKYPPPLLRFIAMKNRTEVVRMCVINPWELRKCQRIAQEMTYNVEPRKEFFCHMATSTRQCLFWAERGWTDVVMAREHDIYIAKTKFNVTAVAQETLKDTSLDLIEKVSQNISLAVTKIDSGISTFAQLEGSKVCSAGINESASFVSPVCTLVYKGIIPKTGNCLESAADFFGDMCVPGALDKDKKANENGTLPEKFVAACNGNIEHYTGIVGSLTCANANNGVAFVDHKVVKRMIATGDYNNTMRIVCENGALPLTAWKDTTCHVGYTPRPIMFVNPERNDTYITKLTTILTEVLKLNTGKAGSINIFDSTEYKFGDKFDSKDLIFKDENNGFTFINESSADQKIEIKNYFQTYNVCETLIPKPTAKFCVVGPEEYQKCVEMKKVFEKTDKLKKIAWGCILGKTQLACMRNVLNGTADIYPGDAKEVFVGGNDLKLQPFVMQDQVIRDTVDDYVHKVFGTHSVAIMKKSKLEHKYGEIVKILNLRNLSVCSTGINKVESFHLPIGRLLSNNIIPRIGSVFESVNRFFRPSCFPGANPEEYKHDLDLVLGHEFNWGIPGLNFYNFTGYNWYIWNSPHTWNFYNYNRKTPGSLARFMKNRLLVPILEGKLSLPDEFDAENFDYSILEDVLSVEGLGDVLSDIPDQIRDKLVENRISRKSKATTFKDLYEERTGDRYVGAKDRHLSRQTAKSYMQQSFESMQDEWGIFEGMDSPMINKKPSKTLTGSQITDIRRFIDGKHDDADPNSIIGNLLQNYDSEYTVPLISKIFANVLQQRFAKLHGLAESMNILRGVPAMSNVRDEQYHWINHPAVQAFVRVYAPRLATYHAGLFDNPEVQSLVNSRYLNPVWLTPTYAEFLDVMKKHMGELTKVCGGYAEKKGVLGDHEPFSSISGAIECIADGGPGDIAFVELEEFVKEVPKSQQTISDYVLVTPLGLVKEVSADMLTNMSFLSNVTFGVKAYPALLTAFNKTGSWRWNVTKALLDAQKVFSTDQNTPSTYSMFGQNGIFDHKTVKLVPIAIQDQTHQTYLGPNLTRSFEALVKPSTFDWWKERRQICSGEVYSNVLTQKEGTCKAVVKDVTCGGMPRPKVISVGETENKKPVVVRMCSRPTRFVREMAEFRCDNGHGYLTPVMVPTTCQCVPCDEIEYQPDWTKDEMWTHHSHKHTITEDVENKMPLWGNEEFWLDHSLNENFQIGEPETEEEMTGSISVGSLIIKPLDTCEANWYGFRWHEEWFPNTNRPVCLGTITGLRRVLTQERVETKIAP